MIQASEKLRGFFGPVPSGRSLLLWLVLALWPSVTHWVYSLSILLWCLGYAIFLAHYVPILGSPRVDGQDG